MIRIGGISKAALTISMIVSSHNAWAAAAATAADQPAVDAVAEDDEAADRANIVVTGTRRSDRTAIESTVPVDVFSTEDLASQASPSLQTILKNLVPSFNQQRNAGADGTAFVRPPTLRGLPPDQILVLINGKRMHRSALVQVAGDSLSAGSQGADLSQIPAVALSRVEVLRDGAAAQYGSDAIAGVINLGLRDNDSGYELNARYGQTYRGDGKDIQISGNAGFKLGNGFFNVSAEFVDQGLFNRALDRPDSAALRALGIAVPTPPTRYGQPESTMYRLVINSAIPVGDTNEVYLFGNYGYADQEVDFNYRRSRAVTVPGVTAFPGVAPVASQTFPVSGLGGGINYLTRIPGLLTATGLPVFDAAGATFSFASLFPNGYTPIFKSRNEDFSGVIGFRGETSFGVLFDLSASIGRNIIKYDMTDTYNPSLGPQSPTEFFLGTLEQREANFNFDASYPWDVGFFSPLNIAVGLEFRRETYEVGLGDAASYAQGPFALQIVQRPNGTRFQQTAGIGADGFPGFGPASATQRSRTNYSVYLDVEADIVESFSLGLAARYDHFSDFGGTFNLKASGRWALADFVALRGAASTGFRAPTPGQAATANVQTGFPNNSTVPIATATVTADSVTGLFFGSQPLTPEESVSVSGGVVITPGGGFNLTVDYYNIEVKDRIAITSSFTVTPAQQAALFALGVANAFDLGQVNYFTNGFRTRTQGVDAVASYQASTGIGTFNTSLAVNYNKTEVTERTIPAAINIQRAANIEGLSPKWRGVLATTWSHDIFDATARVNYFGSITSFNSNAVAVGSITRQTFRPDYSFDLEVGVTLAERFRIAAGAENLFNRYPEREVRNIYAATGAQASGRIYNDASPLSYMGGFWYIRAGVKF